MKIGIVSAATPLDAGLHRLLASRLEIELRRLGHAAEAVFMPFSGEPDGLLAEMAAFHTVPFQEYYDRVIALRPIAHLIRHDSKTLWLTDAVPFYGDADAPAGVGKGWMTQVQALNRRALREADRVFAVLEPLADRLRASDSCDVETLHPPDDAHAAEWEQTIRKLIA